MPYLEDIYKNGEYLSKNPGWHQEDASWKARHIFKILKKNGLQPQSICDIGCGSGGVLQELSSLMPDVSLLEGYDVSPQAIAMCPASDRVHCQVGNIDAIKRAYDVSLCLDVFEHVEDYIGFLRKVLPLSKYHVFHIPLDISVQSILRGAYSEYRGKTGHLHHFNRYTALATLKDLGFEVLDWKYTPSALDCRYQHWFQQMAIVPVRLFFRVAPNPTVSIFGGYSLLVLTSI